MGRSFRRSRRRRDRSARRRIALSLSRIHIDGVGESPRRRVENTPISSVLFLFLPSLTIHCYLSFSPSTTTLPINSPAPPPRCRELNKIYLARRDAAASTEFRRIPVDAGGTSGFAATSKARGGGGGRQRRRDAVTDVGRAPWNGYGCSFQVLSCVGI